MNTRRRALRIALVLVCLLSGMSCTPQVTPVTPPAPPPAPYQAHCSVLCAHLRQLGCEGGKPLPDGTSCETFCIDTNMAGHPIPRNASGQLIPKERIPQIQSCTELQR
jgi:hypothetical protein